MRSSGLACCADCGRHIKLAELSCPHCGASRASGSESCSGVVRTTVAAALGLSMALGGAIGCESNDVYGAPDTTDVTGSETDTVTDTSASTSSTSGTSASGTTTSGATTSGGTTSGSSSAGSDGSSSGASTGSTGGGSGSTGGSTGSTSG